MIEPQQAVSEARSNDESVGKAYHFGTHRSVSPATTLAAISPLTKAMGITRVATITGLDVIGIPVVTVIRPNSRSVAVAQGKGVDLTAAKVSGLMEAIENFHAERIRAPLTLASWEEMCERGALLDIARLPRAAGGAFDPKVRILWLQGHEAMSRKSVWLPYEVVHTDFTLPLPVCSGAFLMSDSGVASGNHPLEATSHAICELVERDAVSLWQFATEEARRRTRIELDTVEDETCRALLERFERAGIRVGVWDTTSDVGLPVFLCSIVEAEPSPWRPLMPATGTGCHPSREVALSRALTEAAQTRLTLIAASRDDIGIAFYRRSEDRSGVAATLDRLGAPAARAFGEVPTFSGATFNEDVSFELSCLERAGIEEVAVVDLRLPEFGIPVVRAVIPGLEGLHDAAGYVAGPRVRARAA